MGTVTNLTTTGNYEAVSGSLKTTFSFAIDHGTGKLKNINGGNVTEGDDEPKSIADFHTVEYGRPDGDEMRVNMNIIKGREIEVATAISEAIAGLEAKIAKGEAL